MRRRVLLALPMLLAAAAGPMPPPPPASPPGVLHIWGNPQMAPLLRRWAAGFRKVAPQIRIETNMTGSDVGMAGLYTGKADIAMLGREAAEMEAKAFEWIHLYPPARVEIATGSAADAGRSPALAILVHTSNPLGALSLAQLKAIFGHGGDAIRSWDRLGVGGGLSGRGINLYGPHAESGTGKFFRQKVLADSNKMDWNRLTEFPDPVRSGPYVDEAGRRVAAAVAGDPAGIGIGILGPSDTGVRAIPLLGDDGHPYLPTVDNVRARRYPLSRSAYAYLNQPKGKPLDPEVAAFLRFILSPLGHAIIEGSGYLPLRPADAHDGLRALE
jgi:phosphate transport system substrate-binding protein